MSATTIEKTKTCTKCNHKLLADDKFCPGCGAKIEKLVPCGSCEKLVNPDDTFCHYCGAKVKFPNKGFDFVSLFVAVIIILAMLSSGIIVL